MSTQYPGPDPDDPFAKPPREGGAASPGAPTPGTEETAPIQRDEVGYWERLAQEQAGQPSAAAPPPPATSDQGDYQQNPTSAQSYGEQPVGDNPWAGYGEPAPQQPYGQPQQPYSATPHAQPYGAPGYPPAYGYAAPYAQPAHPQSTTAMVLGLVGLIGGFFACGVPFFLSPFAWVIGAKAKREIRQSGGQLGGHRAAQTGFVTGIIGTVLLVLGLVAIVALIVIAISSSGSPTTEF